MMVLSGLLPLIAFIGVLISQIRTLQYEAMKASLLNRAEAASAAVETLLGSQMALLNSLAGSPSLDGGNLQVIRRSMERLAISHEEWSTLILTDDSRQLINLRFPAGHTLPLPRDPDSLQRVWTTGRATIGNLVEGRMALRQPVVRDDRVIYTLVAPLKPEILSAVLADQHLPAQWIGSIYDGNGRLIARSEAIEKFLGADPTPAFRDALDAGTRVARITLRTGIDAFGVIVPVRGTFWHIGLAAPVAAVVAPYLPVMRLLYGSGGAAALLAIAIVVLVLLRAKRTTDRRGRMLTARAESAEIASREKSAFLANMSHELRTPLNAVIGFAEVMEHRLYGPLGNRKYEEYVRDIIRSGQHLLDLINDVLDLSKIEAGKMVPQYRVLDPSTVVDHSVALVREEAMKKRINIIVAVAPDLAVFADERLLKQILINVLSNAVKYTPHGEVHISARRRGRQTEIVICDTGIGMDPTELHHALEPYVRGDSEIARKQIGTGLGLPLASRLVELHGGRLYLESRRGVGTTATILLPESGKTVDGKDIVIAA